MCLYFHKFVWQKCQKWWCSAAGMICHDALAPVMTPLPKTRWLTVWCWEGAGPCHPHEGQMATPAWSTTALHWERVVECRENPLRPVRLTGDVQKRKESSLTYNRQFEIKWAESFRKRICQTHTGICCNRLLTLTNHSLDLCILHVCYDSLQWEMIVCGVTQRTWGSCSFPPRRALSILPQAASLLQAPSGAWPPPRVCLVDVNLFSSTLNILTAVHTNGSVCWLLPELFVFHHFNIHGKETKRRSEAQFRFFFSPQISDWYVKVW